MENSLRIDDFATNPRRNTSEAELDYLKNEVDYLRSELDYLTKQHSQSLIEVKHHQEQQISKLLNGKEKDLQEEFATILTLQRVLSKESDESSRMRQRILNAKLEHTENLEEMSLEMEKLLSDADYLRNEAIPNCKEEILQYQKQIELKRLEHSKCLRESERNKHGELYNIEGILEEEENKIKQYEYELQGFRKQLAEKMNYTEGELGKIHSTLRSTQRITEQQENDLKFLRDEREKARKESRDAQKSVSLAKHKVMCLSSESEELKSQLKRLENLTYGT